MFAICKTVTLYCHVFYLNCLSHTVPLPKVKDCRTVAMICDDFRGITISSILSKVFEHCILDRFRNYFSSNDNQFGFKKNLSCSHAIFTINNIVSRFVCGGSTVNLCAVDLSKAFDRINHHAFSSGGSTGGGGAEGAVTPPRGEKKIFFIALQQARPAVRRNFMATLNKTVIIHASLRPECKKNSSTFCNSKHFSNLYPSRGVFRRICNL
jgi:hypothetical protein